MDDTTFQVFRAGFLGQRHERIQMDYLVQSLKAAFDPRDEDCRLIIDCRIPSSFNGVTVFHQIDGIVTKDNKIVIIELKDYDGNVKANCLPGSHWEIDVGKGYVPIASKNPFFQAKGQWVGFSHFLSDRILGSASVKPKEDQESGLIPERVLYNVNAWVITNIGSKPSIEGIRPQEAPWFRVIPLERVAQQLAFERSGRVMSEDQFQELLLQLGASKVPSTEWYRGLALEENLGSQFARIPRIDSLLLAGNEGDFMKALNRIEELDLRQYAINLRESCSRSPASGVRKEAIRILVEWEDDALGTVLTRALGDPDPSIVSFALAYLAKVGFPETFAALSSIIRQGPREYLPAAVLAIASSGHPDSCNAIMGLARSMFSVEKFGTLERLRNTRREWKGLTREEYYSGKRDELAEVEAEVTSFLDCFRTTCQALGELRCSQAVPWLLEFVASPRRIGIKRDTFPEWGDEDAWVCVSIFGHAVRALGKVGDERNLKPMLETLAVATEDYQEPTIMALGDMANEGAVDALASLLDTGPSHFYDHIIHSLGQIGGQKAFGILEPRYLSDPLSDSGRWTMEILSRIDKPRFEKVLLKAITSDVTTEVKNAFLYALVPIASAACADSLFPLLADPALSDRAGWVLGNLISELQSLKGL